MGKAHVTAIIQALQETIENLSVNGCSARSKITNPTVDSQYVQALEDDYGDEIDTIVENIPDDPPPTPPGPTLPTVQNVQCWFNQNQGSASVATSFTRLVYDANNNRIPYSASLLYCVFLLSATETLDGTFEVVRSTNDNLAISRSNGTNSTTVYTVFYASCSDKTSTIIDVYDSQNNVFKAFKYTLDGVDYYRVMEWQNTHPDWVTDLSSIGYHLPVQLPTIYQSRANVSPSNQTIVVDGISLLSRDGQVITYYSDYSYAFRRWVKFTTTDRSPGEIISNAGYLAVKNTGTSDVTGVYNVDYAACSNNQAEVITVYNSSNEAFNAFKFTASGTDYYYVLDEIQNDWTDDLSSIGYSLTPVITLPTVTPYRKSVQYTGYQINAGDSQFLVDSGNKISYDASVIYGFRQWVKLSSIQRSPGEIINDGGFIAAKNTGPTAVSGVYNVDYATCSSNQAELVTVLNSSDEAYNAFKYTVDNTDYYYVLDGTQTDWTDDLSSIGYHLPVQLPSVTVDNTFYGSQSGGTSYINPGSSSDVLRQWSGSSFIGPTIVRDSSCAYAFWKYSDGNGLINPCGKFVVDWYIDPWYPDSEQICAKNPNASAQPFYSAKVATCDSSDATLITVYNSSNEAFNAFKYNDGTTDYYYILDEVQTDWTDDLSSIGYHLPVQLPTVWESTNYYFNKSASGNYYFADNETKDLFSASGYKISYNDTFSYAVVVCKDTSTNEVRIGIPVVKDDVYLSVRNETGAAISLSYASIRSCSSSDATVVTVYDSNNAAFNAFKYTVDNTDYYYVLDNTQADWTDDLSSIGYHLPQLWNLKVYGHDGGTISLSQENNFMYIF